MINLPTPYAAARIAAFVSEHLCWSVFWDKQAGPSVSCGYHATRMTHRVAEGGTGRMLLARSGHTAVRSLAN
jgi:hypothetical protein